MTNRVLGQVRESREVAMPFSLWLEPETDDFAVIQQQVGAWFEGKDKGRGTGYKQWKRWEYLTGRRLTADGKITNATGRNWEEYNNYMSSNPGRDITITNGSWSYLAASNYVNGPSGYNPGIGRVNCIAFHPANANILWVGLPAGGLWVTTNNGGTWSPLTDGLPSIGVSGIVVDPSNTNIIYILTGDGDSGDTRTIGVLKSTNGGTTWYSTGLSFDVSDNHRGYKLIQHPTNSNIIWAVMSNGLWRTTDGGVTWLNMYDDSFRDLEFRPGVPSTIYAVTSSRFYKSVNNGLTWIQITSGLPANESRIAIGVSPGDPFYVYLLCGPGGSGGANTYKGLYRSFDSGETFSLKSASPNILGGDNAGGGDGDQSWYDLAIAVSRTDVADMVCGGINTWRSTDWGANWTITSHWKTTAMPPGVGYTHADIHALEINPLNNRLYCGSDGGIFYSDNLGTTWTDISSGLQPTQWYRIAGYEPNANLIIGGTQDNGSNKYTGSTTVTHMYGADGADCMIDHSNSSIMYFSTQEGGLRRSTDGGNTSGSIAPAGGPWITPVVMNPSTSTTIYGGFGNVYKSTNSGTSWTDLGVEGGGALAIGTNNTGRLYAASATVIRMSNDAGSNWTTVTYGLPGISITGIAVNPDNSADVFITFGGYSAGQKVYRSNNAGTSWTNITGSLPNVPVHCIAYEDNNQSPDDAIYIGTDIGIFYRDNTLGDWVPFSNRLPVVPVFDLEINETSEVVTAATFGRGIWRSSTYTTCQASWSLCCDAPAGYSYYQASDFITSTRVFNDGLGQEGIYKAANSITLSTGFNVTGGSEFKAMLGACGAGIPEVNYTDVTGTYAGPLPELLK
jgi:hypothetical protein